nr:MAG TPA: Protein of unknown function (DUF551) [Caudoviricetes sp.]
MKNEEIIKALRCISTAGGENACEHCPYWKEEKVPEEERPIYGADTMHSCDVDRVGLDGADLIERLTDRCARYAEEIAVAQERQRWISVTERLPEVGRRVLATSGVFVGEAFRAQSGEWARIYGPWNDFLERSVTHWMPLPEGPEEE